ncbi:hypothetical protein L5515_014303 [Caenorhabditis briggsae]|uniref:Uncharacterized protein n=1 Tax=Caenorhabditis briggsae TaxID=6238 RepID=A0AAE9EDX7_CAEBR|nr:hypothetical protein L5515_014303 [Caenorhabditis briggsae]
MSKQLVVNGRTILVEEQDVDEVCAMFKENIIIDSEEGWRKKWKKKIWLAAVFAVKKAFLSSGAIDLKSHKSLSFFADLHFIILVYRGSALIIYPIVGMHGDTYGRGNFSPSEYSSVISDVQTFVNEFSKIDRKKLWSEFSKSFLAGTDPEVQIKKEKHIVKLGGVRYKCDFSAYV